MRQRSIANWLSKEEGIAQDQWCYEANAEGQVIKLKEHYLSLTGYRLPTEAEWEYACRAGAVTSRYYAETAELLGNYGWYFGNSPEQTQPVGGKKPNDLGLFDMQGNVWNWCQDTYKPYPNTRGGKASEDTEEIADIVDKVSRVLRGGSFLYRASFVRSSFRSSLVPTAQYNLNGFRPSRTFTP